MHDFVFDGNQKRHESNHAEPEKIYLKPKSHAHDHTLLCARVCLWEKLGQGLKAGRICCNAR
jgi:hypothetical protein